MVAQDRKPPAVSLAVDAQGHVELDGQTQSDEQLAAMLKQRAADALFQLQIEADKSVPYGRVAELMAIALSKLSFVTVAGVTAARH